MSSRSAISFDPAAAAARALGLPLAGLEDETRLGTAVAACWESLDASRRAALAALVELGGSASVAVLEDETAADLQSAGTGAAQAGPAARAAQEALWESGLFSRDRASRTFYMIPDVAAAFAPLARRALLERLPEAPQPAPPVLDEHLDCCALNLLRHEPLKLTRDGIPYRRSLETLVERLGPLLPGGGRGREAIARAEALMAQLRELGLVRQVRDALEVEPDAVEEWSQLDEPARATLALPADRQAPAVRLLRLIMELGPERAWPEALAARVLRRSLAAAAEAEPAEPLGARRAPQEMLVAMEQLERAGLVGRMASPPGSWGLTAVGRSFPGPPTHPRPKGIHVGHDLTVLVPRGIPPSVHARLGDVARLEAADQVARYRIDRHAVLEALDRGALAGELELFLAENATPVLPDSVRDDLRRWAERFGEVTSRQGICVACSVPRRHEEFDAIVARSGLAVSLVAPGVAVVAPEDHGALSQLLSAAGLTPRRRLQPLPRGSSSAVPFRPAPQPASRATSRRPAVATLAAEVAALPAWGSAFRDEAGRKAAPPPTLVAAQVKEKYRREFGSGELASLDRLDVDELMALEDKGLVRQFLAGKIPAGGQDRRLAELDEYLTDEPQAVTPARARQLMQQAATAGVTCQLAYLQGPGRTQKLIVCPLEIVTDGAGTYLRARLATGSQERMLAIDRIHAVRVVRDSGGGR